MVGGRPPCRCGHPAEVHEHYRRGTDCGACGLPDCPAYSPGLTADQQTALAALAAFTVPTAMPGEEAMPEPDLESADLPDDSDYVYTDPTLDPDTPRINEPGDDVVDVFPDEWGETPTERDQAAINEGNT